MKVEYLDKMGSDLDVVNAARVSFAKESKKLSDKDRKLLGYLAENGHWSPFAHVVLKFRVTAPLFVARQLAKHQVGAAWNEVSRRYVDDPPSFFFPETWRGRPEGSVKQGSAGKVDINKLPGDVLTPEHLAREANLTYQGLLHIGVCPEQARMVLPQNTYTSWIWTGSLYFFYRVCDLRLDVHVQAETRTIAGELAKYCATHFPASWAALCAAREVS